MKTLIELYDERAIENVLGPETFKPETVIYLCTSEIAQDKIKQEKLREYFAHRGLDVKVSFMPCSQYESAKILGQLREIAGSHPDCAIDVTGGTDAELFAAGMFCAESGIPAFTYSRKRNKFYEIKDAGFAAGLECGLEYSVEDFFMMAGGTLRKGRVDNSLLANYMDRFDPFFRTYLPFRRKWVSTVTFMQRISRQPESYTRQSTDSGSQHFDAAPAPVSLDVSGDFYQKGEHGSRVRANTELLEAFAKLGFIKDLNIVPEKTVSFKFEDAQIRSWLRDVGSVLELYVYKACVDAGIFGDVISSAIVDWDGSNTKGSISNEIDVVAVRGTVPLFISCKTCEVKTEALNELAILRDRFGGNGAKSVIVSTEKCNASERNRAAELGIAVIDYDDLAGNRIVDRIKAIMKAD